MQYQKKVKAVVWAHNSHIGDARFTQSSRPRIECCQLVREQFPNESYHIGFTCNTGTVTAASKGAALPNARMFELHCRQLWSTFHSINVPAYCYLLTLMSPGKRAIEQPSWKSDRRNYLPKTERFSHYFYADLPKQFDASFTLMTLLQ